MDEQANVLDLDVIRRVPKVLLHEHLDGGLRPETVQELAREIGYDGLPKDCETDAEALSDWFFRGASRGSLPQYLEGFRHTIALMQTAPALERIAFECMEDLAADGVVYAEVRFAPDFHTSTDLGLDGVMTAVLRGLKHGADDLIVTGAATEIARQPVADTAFVGIRLGVQQGLGSQKETGSADAALEGGVLQEGLL